MSEVLKQKLMRTTRRLGLLGCAEKMREVYVRLRSHRQNEAFIARHPGVPLPPPGLMHDPYAVVDYEWYWDSGKTTATELARIIEENCPAAGGRLKILEWGCGPGRIIRHLAPARAGTSFECHGTDYNKAMIDWCGQHIPTAAFATNELSPPLHYAEGGFDFIYCLSVFTHLSEAMHHAWLAELLRVLKPGGCILLTLHGDYYRRKMLPDELARYEAGGIVVREGFIEGGRMYTAFHGERFVRESLLPAVEILRHETADNRIAPPQDIWLIRKAE